jgi:hypothetical protein
MTAKSQKGVNPLPRWREKTILPVVGPTITVGINSHLPPKLEPNKIHSRPKPNCPQSLATIFLQKLYKGCTRRVLEVFATMNDASNHKTKTAKKGCTRRVQLVRCNSLLYWQMMVAVVVVVVDD